MQALLRRLSDLPIRGTRRIVALSAIVVLTVLLTVPAGVFTTHAGSVARPGPEMAGSAIASAQRSLSEGHGPAVVPAPLHAPDVVPSFSPPTAAGAPWHEVDQLSAPSARATPAMAYDPGSSSVVYFGGGWDLGAAGNDTWTFSNGNWTDISAGLTVAPSAREGAMMTYDASDGYLLLFGGYARSAVNPNVSYTLSDTWKFHAGTWTNITAFSTAAPSSRFESTIAYDYHDGYAVLFGGNRLFGGPLSDTWTFHAGNWTNVTSTSGPAPPGRDFASMTDDPADGYVLLFGGWNSSSSSLYNDTWSFSGGGWAQVATTTAPEPMRGAMIAYDAATKYVLLFGGTTYAAPAWPFALVGDTWTFSAGGWTNRTTSIASSPPARFAGGMTNVSTSGAILLADGCLGQGCAVSVDLSDSWIYDAARAPGFPWVELASPVQPSARATGAIAYDPNGPYVLYFGGGWDLGTSLNDTWTWANGNWTNLTASLSVAPSPREDSRIAYDAADGYIVLFGGYGNGGRGFGAQSFTLNDTWKFQNGTWTNITSLSAKAPPGRFDFGMTYDWQDGYVLLYGGNVFGINTPTSQTWTFHAGVWTNISASSGTPPAGRDFTSMVDDPAAEFVLLFGGWNASTQTVYNDTWSFSHGAWKLLSPANSPPPLRGSPVAYESRGQYVLLFGGTTYSYPGWPFGLRSDTWAFFNNSWFNLTPFITASPPARFVGSMTNLSESGTIVMADGCTGQGCFQSYDISDTWLYNWTNPNGTFGLAGLPGGLDHPTNFSVVAVGGTFHYSYQYGGLPAGCTTADTPHFSCQPTRAGTYAITATVTDTAGRSMTLGLNVTFAPRPLVLSVSVSQPTIDAGQPVTIAATASTPPAASWTYSYAGLPLGCASVDRASFSCSPTQSGTFRIEATVTDAYGDVVRSSAILTVNPSVATTLSASATTVDLTEAVTLTAQVRGGSQSYSYVWSGLPASCTAGASVVSLRCTPTATGSSTVSVTATDSLGEAAASGAISLLVNPLPSLGFTARSVGEAYPLTVAIAATVTGGTGPFAVSWVFGDGTTGSGLSPTHTYAQPGTYVVRGWVNDSRGLGAPSTPLTVSVILPSGPTLSHPFGSLLPSGLSGFLLGLAAGLVALAIVGIWALRRSRAIAEGQHLVGSLEGNTGSDSLPQEAR